MADLTSKERDKLSSEDFAVPGKRALPIHDSTHVKLAWDMVERTKGLSSSERAAARRRIKSKAKELGIDTSDWKVNATMWLEAMSLDLPAVLNHPNRMPFSGVLTRVGIPSDAAPHGSDGKRVLLTAEAAEKAVPSLLGMGVDLTADMDGHDAQSKIGVITAAHVDGDAIKISGFIYAADFPKEALRLHLNAADLGFSFEAQNLRVESMETDPLVVKDLVFTGAAILMKDSAAYHTTSLAAAAAKEHEMNDEMKAAITASITAALAPVTEQIGRLQQSVGKVDGLAAAVEDLRKNPPVVHASAVTMERVEPHAKALDACAASMEAAGVGMHDRRGHVAVARRMAASMRADAAGGKIPHEFNDSNSYYASADRQAPRVEDSDAFKTMQTELATLKAAASAPKIEDSPVFKGLLDKLAATETKLKDVQAAQAEAAPKPDRKTLPPFISSIMSKTGIGMPQNGEKLSISSINAALDKAGITGMQQRIQFKRGLEMQGLLDATN